MSDTNKNSGFLVPLPKTSTVVAIREQKLPAPNRGRNNEVILEEEEYLKNLEKVINKSFFPILHAQDNNTQSQDFETSSQVTGIDPSIVQNDVDKLTINQYMAKYNRYFEYTNIRFSF